MYPECVECGGKMVEDLSISTQPSAVTIILVCIGCGDRVQADKELE